jgi:hypothetical protein
MSFFIGCEQGIAIVEEYNAKSSHPMFLKCYQHLHLVVESKNEFIDQIVDANYNLDMFEMATRTNEPTKEIVKKSFLIFRHYQMDVKEVICSL